MIVKYKGSKYLRIRTCLSENIGLYVFFKNLERLAISKFWHNLLMSSSSWLREVIDWRLSQIPFPYIWTYQILEVFRDHIKNRTKKRRKMLKVARNPPLTHQVIFGVVDIMMNSDPVSEQLLLLSAQTVIEALFRGRYLAYMNRLCHWTITTIIDNCTIKISFLKNQNSNIQSRIIFILWRCRLSLRRFRLFS